MAPRRPPQNIVRYPAVKTRTIIIALIASNLVLILALAGREFQHREERLLWGNEAPHWARGTGAMQAIADSENKDFRFLRLTTVASGEGKYADSGARENGIPIWAWPSYPILGEASRASNQAFVDGYNARMKTAIADAATQPAAGGTADTQSWTGVAQSRMAGPFLAGPNVYIDLADRRWPSEVEGKRVTVTGSAVERHDLPVFIPTGGGPQKHGIPVAPGTDLYKASARTVIEHPQLVGDGR